MSVGVIVARFQVPDLHEAHYKLIEEVTEKHDKVIIFLGCLSPARATRENPLDFEARKQMVLEAFPDVIVTYINDSSSDQQWSRNLDSLIGSLITPAQSPVLYGGRDSFIAHYRGRFPVEELEPQVYERVSGTQVREAVAQGSTESSSGFRKGATWATSNRYPSTEPTVDVAILNEAEDHMLLARKHNEDKLRFIGGFADPGSPSYEADVRREVREEAHIEITDPIYVGSCLVDDWRFRGVDKIKTSLYEAKLFAGSPQPDDDIVELRWVDILDLRMDQHYKEIMVPTHHQLFVMWAQQFIHYNERQGATSQI